MSRSKYLILSLLPAFPVLYLAIWHRGWRSDTYQITLTIWLAYCMIAPALAWSGPLLREHTRGWQLAILHTCAFLAYFVLHVLIAYSACSFLPLEDDRPWNLFQTIRKQSFEPGLLMFATTLLGGHWLTSKTKATAPLTIKSGRRSVVIDWSGVHSIIAHGQYTKVFTNEKVQIFASSLKSVEAQMPTGFVRIHRSCIVNTASIRGTRSLMNGDYELTLCNGQVVRVSRTYRDGLRAVIGSF